MQNGQRTITTTHRSKSPTPFSNRAKRWASNVTRPEVMDFKTHNEAMSGISR